MKSTFKVIVFSIFCAFALSSCKQTTIVKTKTPPPGQVKKASNGKVPPGQAKKATGSKSAAPYAPGQQGKTSKSKGAKK